MSAVDTRAVADQALADADKYPRGDPQRAARLCIYTAIRETSTLTHARRVLDGWHGWPPGLKDVTLQLFDAYTAALN